MNPGQVLLCLWLSLIGNEFTLADERSRDHVDRALLPDEQGESDKHTTDRLQQIYEQKIHPAEQRYHYDLLKNSLLTKAPMTAKPVLLFTGPNTSGKSTAINYILGDRVAPFDSTKSQFTILTHKDEHSELASADGLREVQSTEENRILERYTVLDSHLSDSSKESKADPATWTTLRWLLAQTDLTVLVFDAGANMEQLSDQMNKLVGELQATEAKYRIVLNKADSVTERQLMTAYGQLLWSLSQAMPDQPEAPRIYLASLISTTKKQKPSKERIADQILMADEEELLQGMSAIRTQKMSGRVQTMLTHAKRVQLHARLVNNYIVEYRKRCRLTAAENKKLLKEVSKTVSESADDDMKGWLNELFASDDYQSQLDYEQLSSDNVVDEDCSTDCIYNRLIEAVEKDLPALMGTQGFDEPPTKKAPSVKVVEKQKQVKPEETSKPKKAPQQPKQDKPKEVPKPKVPAKPKETPKPKEASKSKPAVKTKQEADRPNLQKKEVEVEAAQPPPTPAPVPAEVIKREESTSSDSSESHEDESESDTEENEKASAESKLNCKFRKSCYETGEQADIEHKPMSFSMDFSNPLEGIELNTRENSPEQNCKWRTSCYETGVLPDLEAERVTGSSESSTGGFAFELPSFDTSDIEMSEEQRCKWRMSCYESGEIPEIQQTFSIPSFGLPDFEAPELNTRENSPEQNCKWRTSCYETGVLPDLEAERARGPDTSSSSSGFSFELPSFDTSDIEMTDEQKCKWRSSCYETGVLPDLTAAGAASSISMASLSFAAGGFGIPNFPSLDSPANPELSPEQKCKWRSSCYETGELPESKQSWQWSDVFAPGAQSTKQEELSEEDIAALTEQQRHLMLKVRCKYRKSCYETGEVPVIEQHIFGDLGTTSDHNENSEDEDDLDEKRQLMRQKLRCKYRQSCYESGETPKLSSNIWAGGPSANNHITNEESMAQMSEHQQEAMRKLKCKFRQSCYESGELPDIQAGVFSSPPLTSSHDATEKAQVELTEAQAALQRKNQCKYRQSCYETGEVPVIVHQAFASPPTSTSAVHSKEDAADMSEKQKEMAHKLRCKYRESCYESGEVPTIQSQVFAAPPASTPIVNDNEEDENQSEKNRELARKLRCKYRESCYETGVVPETTSGVFFSPPASHHNRNTQDEEDESLSEQERDYQKRLRCKFRPSCYETGVLPDVTGSLYASPSQSTDEDESEISEEASAYNKKLWCKFRYSCYETGFRPKTESHVFASHVESKTQAKDDKDEESIQMKCKFRKSCYDAESGEGGEIQKSEESQDTASKNVERPSASCKHKKNFDVQTPEEVETVAEPSPPSKSRNHMADASAAIPIVAVPVVAVPDVEPQFTETVVSELETDNNGTVSASVEEMPKTSEDEDHNKSGEKESEEVKEEQTSEETEKPLIEEEPFVQVKIDYNTDESTDKTSAADESDEAQDEQTDKEAARTESEEEDEKFDQDPQQDQQHEQAEETEEKDSESVVEAVDPSTLTLEQKMNCLYRTSCYSTGIKPTIRRTSIFEAPTATKQHPSAEDDGSLSEAKQAELMKLRCKFRSSCYESGMLPDLTQQHYVHPKASATHQAADISEMDDEYKKKLACKFRPSCYETGVVPEIVAAIFATPPTSAASDTFDSEELSEQQAAYAKKLFCKYRQDCYETGLKPTIVADVFAAAPQSSTGVHDGLEDAAELSESARQLRHKLFCKYRPSCYETGERPITVQNVFAAAPTHSPEEPVFDPEAADEQQKKVWCKYRESCYESGERPTIVHVAVTHKSSTQHEDGIMVSADQARYQERLRCKYRQSCYETGEVPVITHHVFSVPKETRSQKTTEDDDSETQSEQAQKLKCAYRRSCYETGELPEDLGKWVAPPSTSDSDSREAGNSETDMKMQCRYRRSCYDPSKVSTEDFVRETAHSPKQAAQPADTTVVTAGRNISCNIYRLSCRKALGLPEPEKKNKDVMWIDGVKYCRRKTPLTVVVKEKDDKKKNNQPQPSANSKSS